MIEAITPIVQEQPGYSTPAKSLAEQLQAVVQEQMAQDTPDYATISLGYELATVEPPVSNRETRRPTFKQRVGQRLSALAMAGVALFSPQTSVDIQPHNESVADMVFPADGLSGRPLPSGELNQCPDVNPDTLKVARQLLDMPNNALVMDVKVDVFNHPPIKDVTYKGEMGPYNPQELAYSSATAEPVGIESSFQAAEMVAKRYGLTLHDPMPYLRNINDGRIANIKKMTQGGRRKIGNGSAPYETYIENATQYLNEFGISLSFDGDINHPEQGSAAVNESSIRRGYLDDSLQAIIETFANLPQEYIDMAGLKHINFYYKPDSGALAYVWNRQDGSIYINAGYSQMQPLTLLHELAHLVTFGVCTDNGARKIPQFAKQNGFSDVYQPHSEHIVTQDQYESDRITAMDDIIEDLRRGDLSTAQDRYNQLVAESKLVNFADWGYGGGSSVADGQPGSVVEDSAEIIKNTSSAVRWMSFDNPAFPLLRAKFTMGEALIGTYNPRLMFYFATLGQRDYQPFINFDDLVADNYLVPAQN